MFSSSSPHFFDSGGLFPTELKSFAVVLRDLGFWNSKAETNFSLFDVDLYYLETLSMPNPNCGLSWLKCQRATGNSKKSNHKPTLVDISKLFSFTTVCTCSLDCKTVKKVKVLVGKKRSCQSFNCVQLFGIRGILQARILEWVAVPFSRGSSQPRDWTLVSSVAGVVEKFLIRSVVELEQCGS